MAQIKRSKFAVDIMYRLWDDARSIWVKYQGKSIWSSATTPDRVMRRLLEDGRSPETLSVERVFVGISI